MYWTYLTQCHISIFLTYSNVACDVQCALMLQAQNESRVQQCVTNFCCVFVNTVLVQCYKCAHEPCWLQLITSRLAGVSYEWLNVSRHCVERQVTKEDAGPGPVVWHNLPVDIRA